MGDLFKKNVTLTQAVVACATTLLVAVAGSVAWASSFQTKTAAAAVTARVEVVEKAQVGEAEEIRGTRADVGRVEETVNRLDDKLDRVLLRLGGRR